MNFLVVTDDEQWQTALAPWIEAKEQVTEHHFALHSLNDHLFEPAVTPDVVVLLSRHFSRPSSHKHLQAYDKLPFIYSSPASLDADIAPVIDIHLEPEFISFNAAKGLVRVGNKALSFTETELKIFRYLHQYQGEPVSKQLMQQQILQRDFGKYDRNLDMHIANIRKKLHAVGLPRNVVLTVRGRGYSFNQELLQRLQNELGQ